MKHKDIYELLKLTNLPIAYDHFPDDKRIKPPFIVYREVGVSTFKADQKTYYRPYEFDIELVTTKKDVALEQSIEELLTNNNIPYDKAEDVWDSQEKIYHNFYEI